MKIVQVLHKGTFNTGSVHQMFQLSKGLKELGHQVIILGREKTEVEERARVEGIEYVPMPFKNELDLLTLYKILNFLKREKPQIIHLHKGLELTLFWLASFYFKDLNLVANRGVSFPLKFYNSIKYKSRKVKAIICVCDFIREIVIKSGKINKEKVFTAYAGTDTEEFNPEKEDGYSLREELGLQREDEIICQVGVREWRGWKTAIEAFSLVKKERPEAKLLLVGAKDENLIKEVIEYGKKFNIGKEMVVLGYRKDNVRVAAAQTLSLDLSYEGVGITGTLREAMAMEKPVVASDVGGNRELVLDGEVGFLVPPRDAKSASEAILKLLKDKDLRINFGKKGRKRVEENFSKRIRISKIEKIYKNILKL
ncbi:MAG: glycosyltransferase family 4 protein [Thermoanaerobaculia bacterium]